IHLHDTYFVVAHFHYVMVGGMVMAYLASIHFWWPKITGRLYSEWWGRFSAITIFIGFNLTFFPQFVVGYLGMPRRYHVYPEEFQLWNVMSTLGASILAVGFVLPVIYLLASLFYGKVAGSNPWLAKGLEWEEATSPPLPFNFAKTPIVTEEAYAYHNPARHGPSELGGDEAAPDLPAPGAVGVPAGR
ncbi:MAG: cbb3-type cytochrome c oxidase subunit I, partial [Anaerolineae bacterium]|nr:cbb3-type cytochrome c oxidase subunit I [Anaerolineae bacterium]